MEEVFEAKEEDRTVILTPSFMRFPSVRCPPIHYALLIRVIAERSCVPVFGVSKNHSVFGNQGPYELRPPPLIGRGRNPFSYYDHRLSIYLFLLLIYININ